MSKVRNIKDPEAYNTRKAVAKYLRAVAKEIETKKDGQLAKARIDVDFATEEEIKVNIERKIRALKKKGIDAVCVPNE